MAAYIETLYHYFAYVRGLTRRYMILVDIGRLTRSYLRQLDEV